MPHNKNAFDLLRLILAVLVLVSHAFYFTDHNSEPLAVLSKGQVNMGDVGVMGFFCLSGYLITASFDRAPNILLFLRNRFLRIFPGYWVSLIVTAFVIAPLLFYVNNRSLTGFPFFGTNSSLSYIYSNIYLNIKQYSIGNILNYSAYKQSINGSLWSLFPEITCYIFTIVLGFFGLIKTNRQTFLLFFIFAYTVYVVNIYTYNQVGPTFFILSNARALYTCYLCGTCLYIFKDDIIIDIKGQLFIALIAIAVLRFGGFLIIAPIVFAVLCIRGFSGFQLNFKYDLSFGLYIYAFPVEHVVFNLAGARLPFVVNIFLAGLITTGLAFLSFVFVERVFLRLKSKKTV
ncbi:acyltransferase [Mucilaginibacter sp. ZT4R22]|uniref:Acyltransferase n=1 Tax=Mucilaginibacter pankratovii TaxID=2772110 RepID=A0ABR7WW57_9SPHI|nr:acyltransferase [Mucilaginibacter pankratovii]MBD1366510.1 acyltransferase [Mucilaginibacter pankratovii]